ncbi:MULTISPECIES: hypothetical protein [unclassified Mesorhizobium]|uniref:hypothetical protein n=1 Tax=unclassified Mesorhizobium TaxID=325217 RepID=UPI0024158093|nr:MULTISPECIES: hypothetical protein [unclassified Mesorhizobium]MDG4854069.1 hypothetical protein [Mesorhizobium sp. WSM4982]MDG4910915.1 hypothetical protein [Mesorhizobium sp. WSM4983]
MPTPISTVVDEMHSRLRAKGSEVVTFAWPEFYDMNNAFRWKKERQVSIAEMARDKYGLVVGFGHSAVVVSVDRNFNPG